MIKKKIKIIYIFIILSLTFFGIYNSLNIGISWDELAHYKIGKTRFEFILSFFFLKKQTLTKH